MIPMQLKWFRCAAVLGLASLLVGCWGVSTVPTVDPSTAQFRVSAEVVANAELVREPTVPQWQLGRQAFVRGADRLLVLTHITSVARKNPDGTSTRYDANFERAWITIPFNTPVGAVVKLEELERDFLIGYDANREGRGYFTQPNRITGNVKILEEKPEALVLAINVLVDPKDLLSWRVNEVMEVPVTTRGIYATQALPDTEVVARNRHFVTPPAPAPDSRSATPPSASPDTQTDDAAPDDGDAPPSGRPAW